MATEGFDPCSLLPWDSAFWGFTIARVEGDVLTRARAAEVDAWCRDHGVRCLYFLSRLDDPETVEAAGSASYRLVDVRVGLRREAAAPLPALDPGAGIRESRLGDLPALRAIARGSYRDTRFYFDQRFPRDRCDLLYETWIERSCQGWADVVLVAEPAGEPAGYITCHLDPAAGGGRIGLVGVGESARGSGLGRVLVAAAVEWFRAQGAREVAVATQARNRGALRLYERCGFLTDSLQPWFHKWYPPAEEAR